MDHLAAIFSDLILADQNCFGFEEGYETLLQHIPDSRVVESLRKKWQKDPARSSEDKWTDLKDEVKSYDKGSSQRVRNFIMFPLVKLTRFIGCPHCGVGRYHPQLHLSATGR